MKSIFPSPLRRTTAPFRTRWGRGGFSKPWDPQLARDRHVVGENDRAAMAASQARAGGKAREDGATGSEVHGAVIDGLGTLLLQGEFLPPGRVAVEEAQRLLGRAARGIS